MTRNCLLLVLVIFALTFAACSVPAKSDIQPQSPPITLLDNEQWLSPDHMFAFITGRLSLDPGESIDIWLVELTAGNYYAGCVIPSSSLTLGVSITDPSGNQVYSSLIAGNDHGTISLWASTTGVHRIYLSRIDGEGSYDMDFNLNPMFSCIVNSL